MIKKKIALIVDTNNWAFYNKAAIIKEELQDEFDFRIIPAVDLNGNWLQIILMIKDYDLVHFFWRGFLTTLNRENQVFTSNNIDFEDFIEKNFKKIVKTTCVPDHLWLEDKNIEQTRRILDQVDNYYVSSQKLFDIYSSLNVKKPYGVIIGGVRPDIFYPENLDRFSNLNRTIKIGWAGNSKFGENTSDYEDLKGVRNILIPTIEILKKEGYNLELIMADRAVKFIPNEDMINFYKSIDIYVCTSKSEGGPNTILEAMACGVPIVTTDVGIVRTSIRSKTERLYIRRAYNR